MSTSTLPTRKDRRVSNFVPTDPFDRFDPATKMAGRSRKIAAALMLAGTVGLGACATVPSAGSLPASPTASVADVPVTVEPAPECDMLTADQASLLIEGNTARGAHPVHVFGTWYVPAGTPGIHDDANGTVRVCVQVAS